MTDRMHRLAPSWLGAIPTWSSWQGIMDTPKSVTGFAGGPEWSVIACCPVDMFCSFESELINSAGGQSAHVIVGGLELPSISKAISRIEIQLYLFPRCTNE